MFQEKATGMCSCRVLETAPRRRIGAPRITADDSEVTCRTWQLDQLAPTARKRSDDLAVRIQRRILDPVFKATMMPEVALKKCQLKLDVLQSSTKAPCPKLSLHGDPMQGRTRPCGEMFLGNPHSPPATPPATRDEQ